MSEVCFACEIVRSWQNFFTADVTSVEATGYEGCLQILPRRQPIISLLRPGFMRISLQDKSSVDYFLFEGVLYFDGSTALIVAEDIMNKDDITVDAIRKYSNELTERVLSVGDNLEERAILEQMMNDCLTLESTIGH